jgi:hypothetical protein
MKNKNLTGRMIITYLAIKHNNVWGKIYLSIKDKEMVNESDIYNSLSKISGDYVTIVDDDYPDVLKKLKFPPFVVFLDESDRQNFNDLSSDAYLKYFDIADAMIGA